MFEKRLIADFNIAIICRAYFIFTLGFCFCVEQIFVDHVGYKFRKVFGIWQLKY